VTSVDSFPPPFGQEDPLALPCADLTQDDIKAAAPEIKSATDQDVIEPDRRACSPYRRFCDSRSKVL
jgi:hypothetical protein